ncbi:MAG: type II toxin-antitoxin system RelE/ParE family toxin [Pelobium sp.]
MVIIIWTDLAVNDLKSIHDYIAQDSKFYAQRYIQKLTSRVDQLQKFPESGKIVPEFNTESIRELIEGNYRLVYKIKSEYIGILRVHHAARILRNI